MSRRHLFMIKRSPSKLPYLKIKELNHIPNPLKVTIGKSPCSQAPKVEE